MDALHSTSLIDASGTLRDGVAEGASDALRAWKRRRLVYRQLMAGSATHVSEAPVVRTPPWIDLSPPVEAAGMACGSPLRVSVESAELLPIAREDAMATRTLTELHQEIEEERDDVEVARSSSSRGPPAARAMPGASGSFIITATPAMRLLRLHEELARVLGQAARVTEMLDHSPPLPCTRRPMFLTEVLSLAVRFLSRVHLIDSAMRVVRTSSASSRQQPQARRSTCRLNAEFTTNAEESDVEDALHAAVVTEVRTAIRTMESRSTALMFAL